MRVNTLSCLLALLTLLPVAGRSQVPYRKYKAGDTYKYRLTTNIYRENYESKTIAVSEHRVVNDGGILAEEIKWLSLQSIGGNKTVSLDSVARSVKPYRISLLPEGKVLLPKLTNEAMVGSITDLNTFFVAIAPAGNAQKLSDKNPVIQNAEVREGNFADSITILYGRDCIKVSQHLISTDKHYTIIRTDFTPPDSFCLTPLLDTIAIKISDKPNNFQMVKKDMGDRRNLFWGVETFSITSKIDNQTGALVDASMENTLTLRIRIHTTPDLKDHKAEMPFLIKRSLHLELLNR